MWRESGCNWPIKLLSITAEIWISHWTWGSRWGWNAGLSSLRLGLKRDLRIWREAHIWGFCHKQFLTGYSALVTLGGCHDPVGALITLGECLDLMGALMSLLGCLYLYSKTSYYTSLIVSKSDSRRDSSNLISHILSSNYFFFLKIATWSLF